MLIANTARLRKERVLRGLSQIGLAKEINIATATISRAERGMQITPRLSKKICDYFNLPFDDLFIIQD